MTDRDAFVLALRENPKDETLRLVFADFLNEHGEAELEAILRSEHGEYCVATFAARPDGTAFDEAVHAAHAMAKLLQSFKQLWTDLLEPHRSWCRGRFGFLRSYLPRMEAYPAPRIAIKQPTGLGQPREPKLVRPLLCQVAAAPAPKTQLVRGRGRPETKIPRRRGA